MTAPFGGYKQSGIGRDKSFHAFAEYTEVKATWVNLAGRDKNGFGGTASRSSWRQGH